MTGSLLDKSFNSLKQMQKLAKPTQHIGMFDSGVGGLTVMRQLIKLLPKESVVYYGDTARIPYGDKSQETIIRYSIENATFLIEQGIKLLVIPCNTATAYALEKLQETFQIPIIGVIQPSAAAAVKATRNKRIAILGTKGTIRSGVYEIEIRKLLPGAHLVPVACPLFVPLVEEQFMDHPASRLIVREYLEPIKRENVDTVLLGCTHYPLLSHLIQDELGPDVVLVDSAHSCSEAVSEMLRGLKLENGDEGGVDPEHRYFVSDDPESFHSKSQRFLGRPVGVVRMRNG